MFAPVVPLSLAFAIGVAALQTQRELPGLVLLSCIAAAGVLSAAVGAWSSRRHLRLFVLAVFCCCAGFVWASVRAETRLADRLSPQLEGLDLPVEGRVAAMPQEVERGVGFPFEVEHAQAGVPSRLQLAWYHDGKHPVPAVHAGERWRFVVKLKRPRGTANPHGFDTEARMLGDGVGASGYVRPTGAAERIDAGPQGLGDWVERRREAVRSNFAEALPDSPWRAVLVALAIGDQRGVTMDIYIQVVKWEPLATTI